MSDHRTVHRPAPDGEVSLFEVWQILARRKAAVLACVFAGAVVGTVAASFSQPVYEASVKLRIGQVADHGLLESAEELSFRTLAQYGEKIADGVKRQRPFLTRANPQKGVPSTVALVAEGRTPDEAAGLLARVVHDIQQAHDATAERNVKLINERLETLQAAKSTFQQQFRDANALLEQLKHQNAVQASLIVLELGRISNSIGELDAERPALSQKLVPPQTRRTELLGEIVAPGRPASLNTALLVTLATLIGLASGIVLSFLAEFVANARRLPPIGTET